MSWTTAEGANYEEAVTALLKSLGADKTEVEIESLGEQRKMFGLGGTVTKVRGRFKEEKEESEREEAEERTSVREKRPAAEEPSGPELAGFREKAREFLTEVLQGMEVAGASVEATSNGNHVTLNIVSDAGGLVIGRGGETLEALQTIMEIYGSRMNEGRVKVIVDTENYRARREEKLKEIAEKAAQDAVSRGKKVFLGSMKASERKLVHTILQNNPRVHTKSQGDGDSRQVVVYPVK